MTVNIEEYIPAVEQQGLNSAKDGTLAGDYTFSGAVSFTGAMNGVRKSVTTTTASAITVTAAQSGEVFLATASSGTQTFTLPAPAEGLIYTFIAGHADGEILIDPNGTESITATAFAAVGADADTAIVAVTSGTGIKNTAASNAVGDSITLVSDGTSWYGVGIASGIWATQ